jgi:ParB-like chromosome segregation protein Spo0J
MHTSLEVRTLPIESLKPAPYNPRRVLKPTDPAYRKLRASLESFGLVEPLVWNELTGHVVGGHARLRILKELGAVEVPVSVVRLDAAREKALNVVLNNSEAQGRYEPARLADLLHELQDLPEFELSGFTADTLRQLTLQPVPSLPDDTDPERVEVVLLTHRDQLQRIRKPLNDLVRRFDLEVHVKYG